MVTQREQYGNAFRTTATQCEQWEPIVNDSNRMLTMATHMEFMEDKIV